jgi:hypothetical protein
MCNSHLGAKPMFSYDSAQNRPMFTLFALLTKKRRALVPLQRGPKHRVTARPDPRHLHRLPFSIHTKTGRVAIPFASPDGMPRCIEDMPHVGDPACSSWTPSKATDNE